MKIKKIWKKILGFFSIISGIIIALLAGMKLNKFLSDRKIKQKNWKPVQGRPDYVELYENGKWKEVKLPEDKNGKQIKNNEIKTIGISKEGVLNVTIKKGATNRRDGISLDDDVFTPMDL